MDLAPRDGERELSSRSSAFLGVAAFAARSEAGDCSPFVEAFCRGIDAKPVVDAEQACLLQAVRFRRYGPLELGSDRMRDMFATMLRERLGDPSGCCVNR